MTLISPITPESVQFPKTWDEARPMLEALLGKRGFIFNRLISLVNTDLVMAVDGDEGIPPNLSTVTVDVAWDNITSGEALFKHNLGREPMGYVPIMHIGRHYWIAGHPHLVHMMVKPSADRYETSIHTDGLTFTQDSKTVQRAVGSGSWPFRAEMEGGYVYPTGSAVGPLTRWKVDTVTDTNNLELKNAWATASESDIMGFVQMRWESDSFYMWSSNTNMWARLLLF